MSDLPPFVKHFGLMMQHQAAEEALKENKCPECGNELIHEAGCKRCLECGWTACDN